MRISEKKNHFQKKKKVNMSRPPIHRLDIDELSEWLSEIGVQEPIIGRIHSEGIDGSRLVKITDDELKDFGIPGGKIILIRHIIDEYLANLSKLQSVPASAKRIDVLENYDCKEIAESTAETALKGVGVERTNTLYKRIHDAAKVIKKDDTCGPLSLDDVIMILLYTYDLGRSLFEKNLYYIVNKRLRESSTRTPSSCDLYILYLLTALRRLKRYPMNGGTVLYRAISCDKPITGYDDNSVVELKGFSSTTLNQKEVKGFLRDDDKHKYTFKISGNPICYSISKYSFLSNEEGKSILVNKPSTY